MMMINTCLHTGGFHLRITGVIHGEQQKKAGHSLLILLLSFFARMSGAHSAEISLTQNYALCL
jgi:hypothetical protein